MPLKFVLVIFLILCYLHSSDSIWGSTVWTNFWQRFSRNATIPQTKILKCNKVKLCDENKILLQLARLYITSPERIILLITMDPICGTCADVKDVITNINATIASCPKPPPSDGLYMKLFNGLIFYYDFVCNYKEKSKIKSIIHYHECLTELREDLIECEGPPDWFERKNETVVCQYFNEIANCNYIKAAMLCGLKAAVMMRTFTIEVMRRVVTYKCKVPCSLPVVQNPAIASRMQYSKAIIPLTCYLFNYMN